MTAVTSQKFLIGFWASTVLMVFADIVAVPIVFYFTSLSCIFFLCIYYNNIKDLSHNEIDIYMYGIFLLLLIIYLSFISSIQKITESYSGWGFMIVHQLYIQIFKKEGTRVFQSRRVNLIFITLPIILCFLYIGLKLTKIPDNVFIFSIIYPIHKLLMLITALYRPVNDKSYKYVVIGCLCSLLTDLGYTHYVFELKESYYNAVVIFPYMIAQYFLIIGILNNIGNKPAIFSNRIKRFFQSLFTM